MDKWTPSLWLTAKPYEAYKGTEGITLPPARKLLEQSGLLVSQPPLSSSKGYQSPPHNARLDAELSVLDIGSGLGQVTIALLEALRAHQGRSRVKIIAGEIDDSLLGNLRDQKKSDAWGEVDVEKLDANQLDKPDNTFDYIFANFLYFLLPDPIAGLKESIRVLKPGGSLSLSTWACSAPLQLIQRSIALLPSFPLIPPSPPPGGSWSHPEFVRKILTDNGLTGIKIEPYHFVQEARSPADMARKMLPVVPIMTAKWGEDRQELGWKVFEKIEEVLTAEKGHGPVKIWSVALIVTAKKPQ
ncbi:hypothetical protein I302_107884 [Kwoniella bestiolae CBS 10118]|uniref:Methyltransferase domain-containing protein n=1 Tax=Kwoniella bestiolae CBS 10118 TaxID=1296100 RepID=A0A1B9FXA1_9TREE|nr:hypothetical protein I302_06374 [Kwoniella bestiolae CBS 10118]OCF23393.1 hypothetical protein I302_06374 [Kwoniella bestiolae CBS 10118]